MKRTTREKCRACGAPPGFACVTRLGIPLWLRDYNGFDHHEQPPIVGSAEIPKKHQAKSSGALAR